MMNDTNIYKLQNKLNWKKKNFATELFDHPHIATVCVFVGTHLLSTQNLLSLDTVFSCTL